MDSLSNALASPTEIELQGRKYIISPMVIGDWADFQKFVLQQKIDRGILALKRAYGDNIPGKLLTETLSQKIKTWKEAKKDKDGKETMVEVSEVDDAADSLDSAFFLHHPARLKRL